MSFDADAQGLATRALGQSGPNSIPGVYNYSPLTLPNYRAALAKMRAGLQNVTVALIGDSTTAGAGAGSGGGVYQLNGARAKSLPSYLASLMTSAGVAAEAETFFGEAGVTFATPYNSYDPRLVLGTGWGTSGATLGLGGSFFNTSATTAALSFTPTTAVDTFDIYYARNSGLATFTVNVDGGSTLATVNGAGAATLLKQTVTATLGTHTLNIQNSTAGITYINGVHAYSSAAKKVALLNMGRTGWKTADWLDASSGWSPFNALPLVAADLTVINLGINDAINAVPLATYEANLRALATQAARSGAGDVLVVVPFPVDVTQASLATQQSYWAAASRLKDVAVVLDLGFRYGSREAMATHGLTNGSDTLHPNASGYTDAASPLLRLMCWP